MIIGPLGLVVGGLSGKKQSDDVVSRVDLRIVVNNIKEPTYVINLLDQEVKKSSWHYSSALEKAKKWHNIISVIIKKADENKNIASMAVQNHTISIADEITKLNDLREKGVLTTDEFNNLKNKLLGK